MIPDPVAKVMLRSLATNVPVDKYRLKTAPERMHFISGMPLPKALVVINAGAPIAMMLHVHMNPPHTNH